VTSCARFRAVRSSICNAGANVRSGISKVDNNEGAQNEFSPKHRAEKELVKRGPLAFCITFWGPQGRVTQLNNGIFYGLHSTEMALEFGEKRTPIRFARNVSEELPKAAVQRLTAGWVADTGKGCIV